MTLTTIAFLFITSVFFWRGYKNGFMDSITRVLCVAIAYPAGIFFTNPLANFVFSHTLFSGMLVYFASGSAIFFMVSSIATTLMKHVVGGALEKRITDRGSKMGGAIVGASVGGMIGLLAVYAIGITLKPSQTKTETNNPNAPTSNYQLSKKHNNEDTFIDTSAKMFVSHAISTAVEFSTQNKAAAQISKVFAQNPQEMLAHIQRISNDGALKELISDPEIQTLLKKRDTQSLLNDWRFQHLMNSADMQAILVNADVEDEQGKFGQDIAAEKMVNAWRHIDAVKNDPRVVSILNDAEFQQQLNSTNKLPIMMNPKLKQLTDIIFSSDYKKTIPTTNNNGGNSEAPL